MHHATLYAAARQWLGTPYHHQARTRGVGADCIGFIAGLLQEVTCQAVPVPGTYGRYPDPAAALLAIARSGVARAIAVEEAGPGDVLYIAMRTEPQHFLLLMPEGRAIHCIEPIGVVDVTLAPWMRSRARHAFRLLCLEAAP